MEKKTSQVFLWSNHKWLENNQRFFFQVVILVAELLFDCIACCANKKSSPRKQAISASKLMLR